MTPVRQTNVRCDRVIWVRAASVGEAPSKAGRFRPSPLVLWVPGFDGFVCGFLKSLGLAAAVVECLGGTSEGLGRPASHGR